MISRFLSSMMKIVLPLCLLFPAVTLANALEGIRVWPSPDETRVVIDLKSEADYSYFSLSGPSRIVVDLKTPR